MADLTKLWDEIHKPKEFENKKIEEQFEFDFEMFPHKVYQEDKFVEKAQALKKRFSNGLPNSLFNGSANNVPIDGLGIFLDQTW